MSCVDQLFKDEMLREDHVEAMTQDFSYIDHFADTDPASYSNDIDDDMIDDIIDGRYSDEEEEDDYDL